jgi:hypothetical protein
MRLVKKHGFILAGIKNQGGQPGPKRIEIRHLCPFNRAGSGCGGFNHRPSATHVF